MHLRCTEDDDDAQPWLCLTSPNFSPLRPARHPSARYLRTPERFLTRPSAPTTILVTLGLLLGHLPTPETRGTPLRHPLSRRACYTMKLSPARSSTVAAALVSLAVAFPCDHIQVDGQKFDFSSLGGPHSVITTIRNETPWEWRNTTYTLDLCKPLEKKGGGRASESCPNGSRGPFARAPVLPSGVA